MPTKEIIRLVPPHNARPSLIRIDSPSGSHVARYLLRLGLLTALGGAVHSSAFAGAPAKPTLFDSFLSVDVRFMDAARIDAARVAFETLAREAARCGSDTIPNADRASCLISTIFASEEIVPVAEPGDPESSTVSSVLDAHRGNCAAMTAVTLAVADRVNLPMEAVVFPQHVVVRSPGTPDRVFEMLERGRSLTMAQLRRRLGVQAGHAATVRSNAFLAYYIDNLAVRFADAESEDRAETMFKLAIDTDPRVARIRFNYGTYLLGVGRLDPAKEQLRRAVRLDRHNAPAWANLGVVSARLGDKTGARRCFEKALREEHGNTTASENLRILNHDGSTPRR